jgi:hypothetical protein
MASGELRTAVLETGNGLSGMVPHPEAFQVLKSGLLAVSPSRCPGQSICPGSLPCGIRRGCFHRPPYPEEIGTHTSITIWPYNLQVTQTNFADCISEGTS